MILRIPPRKEQVWQVIVVAITIAMIVKLEFCRRGY